MTKKISSRFEVRPTSDGAFQPDIALTKTLARTPLTFADAASAAVGRIDVPCGAGRLTDALSGPLAALALKNLRVQPRQARSIQSVERILSTAADMTFSQRRTHTISVEAIAKSAGVTPQAAYRYFRDAGDLIGTGLRCVVVREHERVIELLSDRVVADEAEMAALIVGIVLDTCRRISGFPSHVQADLIREYRQVGYDASLLMSEIICKDADRLDVRSTVDVFKASVALAATIAVATSFLPCIADAERRSRLEHMLGGLFIGVLQSGDDSSDAFREIGCRFGDLWAGEAG